MQNTAKIRRKSVLTVDRKVQAEFARTAVQCSIVQNLVKVALENTREFKIDCISVTHCSVTCLDEDKDDHKDICKDILQEHRLYEKPSHYSSSIKLAMDTSKNEDSWEVNLSPPHSTLVFPQDPLCVQDIDTGY